MRTSALAISLALALAAPQIVAQQSPEIPSARAPSTAATVSDAELETFAAIYADLLDIAAKFESDMKSAKTEEEALDIRQKTQTESIAKVAGRGWTPEKFNSVSEAINRDPELTERAVQLIEAR